MEPPRSREGHTHNRKEFKHELRHQYPSCVLPLFLVSSCMAKYIHTKERACVCRGCLSTGFDPGRVGSVRFDL